MILAGDGPGGVVLRRLLPAAIALPMTLAALMLSGERLGLFSVEFGVWLFASAVTVALVAVMWVVAASSERAGRQRSQLEGMLLSVAQTASDAIVTLTDAGQISYVNGALASMFGYEQTALVGQPGEVLFAARDRAQLDERHARLLATGDPRAAGGVVEVTGVRSDGREFAVEISSGIWGSSGEQVVASIIRDVSIRHRAEQKLGGLLESAPDAIVIANRDGEIVLANARAEAIFGYTRAELVGSSVELLMPEQKRDKHAALRRGYADNPRPRHGSRPGEFTHAVRMAACSRPRSR